MAELIVENENLKRELEKVKSESIMIIKALNEHNSQLNQQLQKLTEESNTCIKEMVANFRFNKLLYTCRLDRKLFIIIKRRI